MPPVATCTNCGEQKVYQRDGLTGLPEEEWGTVRLQCGCDEHLPHHELEHKSRDETTGLERV